MDNFISNFRRALSGEGINHERLLQFGNTTYWCNITYDPARNSSGKIIGISYNSQILQKEFWNRKNA